MQAALVRNLIAGFPRASKRNLKEERTGASGHRRCASSHAVRDDLYTQLKQLNRLDLFPSRYLTLDSIAACTMVQWLMFPSELGREPEASDQQRLRWAVLCWLAYVVAGPRSHSPSLRIDLRDRPLRGNLPHLATDENRAAHRPVEIIRHISKRELRPLRSTPVALQLELDDPLLAEVRDEQVIARLVDDDAVGHCAGGASQGDAIRLRLSRARWMRSGQGVS